MGIGRIFGLGFFGLVGLIILGAVFGGFYTVDAGERAVVLRYGAVIDTTGPGLHFKLPYIDSVETISTRTFTLRYDDEPFYSRDQQPATADVSVTFSVIPDAVAQIYSQYGDLETLAQRIINPRVKKEFKEVMGQFTAAIAVQDRERMGIEVTKAVGAESPVMVIESVQVEDIDFSDAYEQSNETKMLAEVEILTVRQNVEREKATAEITVTKAQAEADSRVAKAKAEAEAIRLRGEAEATAINAKGEALRDNPSLISLIQAEKWDGVLPTTMVPNGTVPFLNVDKMVEPVK